ncbi:hypothetical protein [Paraburkholderia xenovorans]|uniref:hypothetical protein n=1 Tax=Paraburkholderia xenovorans TaxID=36873 RepID=UPI0015C54C40|nr:hypothetical protein [Paraburkholderia xenovorans]NPT37744.1 hypothetical protein [Paraburkholderia xenovorans]
MIGISRGPVGLAVHVPKVWNNPANDLLDMSAGGRFDSEDAIDMRTHIRQASLVEATGKPLFELAPDTLTGKEDDTEIIVETTMDGRWHILDLPMPGSIHAAAALRQQITRIHAYGWAGREGWIVAR